MQQHDLSATSGHKNSAIPLLTIAQAFANQVDFCRAHDAPITARVVAGIAALLANPSSDFAQRLADWRGNALADALPLRAAAGFHALYLTQRAPELVALYAHQNTPADGDKTDRDRGDANKDDAADSTADNSAAAIIHAVAQQYSDQLLPWLDSPPQTNEAGRSALFMAAMLRLADHGCPPNFDVLEIGSSAGANLMMDRYHYDLAGVAVGPANPILAIQPEWRGPPPPQHDVQFHGLKGCDIAPIDLTDDHQSAPLMAYIWPDHPIRFARLRAAIASAKASPPNLHRASAADFVEQQLRRPQPAGTTRLLMHSLVWQYLPDDQQRRITAAMQAAGQAATADRPLAWISFEANRTIADNQLHLRCWPYAPTAQLLAEAHPHGAWINWRGPSRASRAATDFSK